VRKPPPGTHFVDPELHNVADSTDSQLHVRVHTFARHCLLDGLKLVGPHPAVSIRYHCSRILVVSAHHMTRNVQVKAFPSNGALFRLGYNTLIRKL
jgi:hypothetical protein